MPRTKVTHITPTVPFLDFMPQKALTTQNISTAHVIGDLHGSEFSFIQQLILLGIIEFSPTDLKILSELAKSTVLDQIRELISVMAKNVKEKKNDTPEHEGYIFLYKMLREEALNEMNQFSEILKRMLILNVEKLILLIGDEIADRNNCLWAILALINELCNRNVNIQILLSNHGLVLLYALILNQWKLNSSVCILDPEYARSLRGIQTKLKIGILEQQNLDLLLDNWLSLLHLISYSYSDTSITCYSHAPIGLDTIEALAIKYQLTYDDSSRDKLAQTIEAIDNAFRESLIDNQLALDELCILAKKYSIVWSESTCENLAQTIMLIEATITESDDNEDKITMDSIRQKFIYHLCAEIYNNMTGPLLDILWNRERSELVRPERLSDGTMCFFTNGHDRPEFQSAQTESEITLDHEWGKPILHCAVKYLFNKASFIKIINVLDDNTWQITYYGHSTSGKTELDGFQSTRENLPAQYFCGIFCMPKPNFTFQDKILLEIMQTNIIHLKIEKDMQKKPISTAIYLNEEDISFPCLNIIDELFSPQLLAQTEEDEAREEIASISSPSPPPSPPDSTPPSSPATVSERYSSYAGVLFSTTITAEKNKFTPVFASSPECPL